MTNKQNLPNRIEKAKAAKQFHKVMQYNADGLVKTVLLPGSDAKQYLVIIRRERV